MNDDKINDIRAKALTALGAPQHVKCPTCGRASDSPYRRVTDRGKVVEGCIDAFHAGRLIGESLRWHNRPSARVIRRAELAALRF